MRDMTTVNFEECRLLRYGSQERIASIFRGRRRYVPPKRPFTQDLHGATSQKTAFFLSGGRQFLILVFRREYFILSRAKSSTNVTTTNNNNLWGFSPPASYTDRGDSLRWPRDNLYPLKLALTSPTSGGRSVGRYMTTTPGYNQRISDVILLREYKMAELIASYKQRMQPLFPYALQYFFRPWSKYRFIVTYFISMAFALNLLLFYVQFRKTMHSWNTTCHQKFISNEPSILTSVTETYHVERT
jgi:hypothetical protein